MNNLGSGELTESHSIGQSEKKGTVRQNRCIQYLTIEKLFAVSVYVSVAGMLEKAVFFAEYENINKTGVSGE